MGKMKFIGITVGSVVGLISTSFISMAFFAGLDNPIADVLSLLSFAILWGSIIIIVPLALIIAIFYGAPK